MNKLRIAWMLPALALGASAHAQGSVTLYGLIDAGIMYTNNVSKDGSKGSLWQATSGTINGSRFGLRGSEDLGGGLRAIFVLENGFDLQDGRLDQNGREFGRQAFIGVASAKYGELTLGRQYDAVVDFVAPLSATARTFGDTGFAHPFDNDNLTHSVRMSNSAKYTSRPLAGFKFGALYAFSNNADFAANRAYSAGGSYSYGRFNVAIGYLHIRGSDSTNRTGAIDVAESEADGTGGFVLGASRQWVLGAGANYTYGPAVIGFVYTRSVFQGSNSFDSVNGAMSFNNYEVNTKYTVTPAITLGISDTYTEGHVGNSRTFGTDPKFNQVNVQAIYTFSKRSDVYAEAMYQHTIGAQYVAFINASDGASSTANQVVGTIGIRTRF